MCEGRIKYLDVTFFVAYVRSVRTEEPMIPSRPLGIIALGVSFLMLVGCAAAPAKLASLTPLEQLHKQKKSCEEAYGGDGVRRLFLAPYTPTTRAEYEIWVLDGYLKQDKALNNCKNAATAKYNGWTDEDIQQIFR
jgi:hypothetical protein